MIEFTNPRLKAEFDDWPIGGSLRGKCVFQVHRDKRGYRIERRTTNKNGQWCKPKFTTYSGQAAIVDGSDGRTYILQVDDGYGFIKISRSDFLDAIRETGRISAEVFENNEPDLHTTLLRVIVLGGACAMGVA